MNPEMKNLRKRMRKLEKQMSALLRADALLREAVKKDD